MTTQAVETEPVTKNIAEIEQQSTGYLGNADQAQHASGTGFDIQNPPGTDIDIQTAVEHPHVEIGWRARPTVRHQYFHLAAIDHAGETQSEIGRSVVTGKSVSVRVALGGRSMIKKQKTNYLTY